MVHIGKKKVKQERRTVSIINGNTNFSVVEAYKSLRTNLMFAAQKRGCKVIITSTTPYEGKSTNCCNLGITLAQTNSNVLIIDCDLRKPTIHKFFKVKGIPGLSEVLAGMNDAEEAVQDTGYDKLKVICGGTIPPNPAELLGSAVMDELLKSLSMQYDYILLDTPPINVVTDALALTTMTDGVVMVVRQGQTTHPEFGRALSRLKFTNAKVLGIILNGVANNGHYGYSKQGYRKYHYQYGEQYK
ncbi:MAG TPA: CpsD/CapB family tyrosine-protein kinase [Anaerovoracaceae bacterium]|nr:CpsD/CapB family tyrosine-protein kinase [Anaerovoracaceae bacterium]